MRPDQEPLMVPLIVVKEIVMLDLTKMALESQSTPASERRIHLLEIGVGGPVVKCEEVSDGYILTLKDYYGESISPVVFGFDKWSEAVRHVCKTFDVFSYTASSLFQGDKKIPMIGFNLASGGYEVNSPKRTMLEKSALYKKPDMTPSELWEQQVKKGGK